MPKGPMYAKSSLRDLAYSNSKYASSYVKDVAHDSLNFFDKDELVTPTDIGVIFHNPKIEFYKDDTWHLVSCHPNLTLLIETVDSNPTVPNQRRFRIKKIKTGLHSDEKEDELLHGVELRKAVKFVWNAFKEESIKESSEIGDWVSDPTNQWVSTRQCLGVKSLSEAYKETYNENKTMLKTLMKFFLPETNCKVLRDGAIMIKDPTIEIQNAKTGQILTIAVKDATYKLIKWRDQYDVVTVYTHLGNPIESHLSKYYTYCENAAENIFKNCMVKGLRQEGIE